MSFETNAELDSASVSDTDVADPALNLRLITGVTADAELCSMALRRLVDWVRTPLAK